MELSMISGARYQRVATYSVRKPVWSCSGSAIRASPKSQIWGWGRTEGITPQVRWPGGNRYAQYRGLGGSMVAWRGHDSPNFGLWGPMVAWGEH